MASCLTHRSMRRSPRRPSIARPPPPPRPRLSVPIDQLDGASDLHGAGLTSLATVGLMLALEERFEIEFPDALLSRRTFGSIDALASAVDALRSGRAV